MLASFDSVAGCVPVRYDVTRRKIKCSRYHDYGPRIIIQIILLLITRDIYQKSKL